MFRQNKQNRKDARKLFAFLQPTAAISLKFSLKTRVKCAQERRNLANLKPEPQEPLPRLVVLAPKTRIARYLRRRLALHRLNLKRIYPFFRFCANSM